MGNEFNDSIINQNADVSDSIKGIQSQINSYISNSVNDLIEFNRGFFERILDILNKSPYWNLLIGAFTGVIITLIVTYFLKTINFRCRYIKYNNCYYVSKLKNENDKHYFQKIKINIWKRYFKIDGFSIKDNEEYNSGNNKRHPFINGKISFYDNIKNYGRGYYKHDIKED